MTQAAMDNDTMVAQADRYAAADYIDGELAYPTTRGRHIREGRLDDDNTVQAFARHRHQSGRTGDREGVKNVGCNYCGAKVALMGADYLEQLADALDKVGAPRKSPDGNEHYGLEKRIAALGEGRTGAGEALQEAAGAVLSAIYGADIDPFAEPEKWEFAEGVAKSVLAALSQSTAGEDET